MVDGGSGMSSIGVDFDTWTEDSGITITNGAVFWMDPSAAEPLRDSNDADPIHTVLAHITVPTGEDVTATFGEVQGRSVGGTIPGDDRVDDWKVYDIVLSSRQEVVVDECGVQNGDSSSCMVRPSPCVLRQSCLHL